MNFGSDNKNSEYSIKLLTEKDTSLSLMVY